MQQISELSPKQTKAILALIESDDIATASSAAGVNRSTIFRWFQDAAFSEAYRSVRFEVWQQSIAILQRASRTAARALEEIAADVSAPVTGRVSAARAILEHARASIETEALAADVKELLAEHRARKARGKSA
jgi:AcrR family transcriptional regulator